MIVINIKSIQTHCFCTYRPNPTKIQQIKWILKVYYVRQALLKTATLYEIDYEITNYSIWNYEF